jgi:hypothetical protein
MDLNLTELNQVVITVTQYWQNITLPSAQQEFTNTYLLTYSMEQSPS